MRVRVPLAAQGRIIDDTPFFWSLFVQLQAGGRVACHRLFCQDLSGALPLSYDVEAPAQCGVGHASPGGIVDGG